MVHAFGIVWAAVAALVFMSVSASIWSRSKVLSIAAILLAIALQASLAYYALGSDGVNQLLSALRFRP